MSGMNERQECLCLLGIKYIRHRHPRSSRSAQVQYWVLGVMSVEQLFLRLRLPRFASPTYSPFLAVSSACPARRATPSVAADPVACPNAVLQSNCPRPEEAHGRESTRRAYEGGVWYVPQPVVGP